MNKFAINTFFFLLLKSLCTLTVLKLAHLQLKFPLNSSPLDIGFEAIEEDLAVSAVTIQVFLFL